MMIRIISTKFRNIRKKSVAVGGKGICCRRESYHNTILVCAHVFDKRTLHVQYYYALLFSIM